MKVKIKPWLKGQSIFSYVKEHIDKKGFFTPAQLPDKAIASTDSILSLELGAADAFLASSDALGNEDLGSIISGALSAYSKFPSEENSVALYYAISSAPCILYQEDLMDLLEKEAPCAALGKLSTEWLYTSPHREAVKFAIMVTSMLITTKQTMREGLKLKRDLLLLGRCEEFTSYVLYALRNENMLSPREIRTLMMHTTGWGKVSAMEEYEFSDPKDIKWLLSHGSELTVSYPPIALLICKEGHILEALSHGPVTTDMYLGILAALNNYLIFLLHYYSEDNEELKDDLPVMDLFTTLQEVLKLGDSFATQLEALAGFINLAEYLTALADNHLWQQLTSNQCHLLISAAEKLIFQKNWPSIIKRKLISPQGALNSLAASLALALQVDVHNKLLKHVTSHPAQTEIYFFLLQTDSEKEFQNILALVQKHLKEYLLTEDALKPILTALTKNPGDGEGIVIASLTSIYDGTRAYALSVLENWPPQKISSEIRLALLKAKAMCQHPLLGVRIDLLLNSQGKDFSGIMELVLDAKD